MSSKYRTTVYNYRAIAEDCRQLQATWVRGARRSLLDWYIDNLGEELPEAIVRAACEENGVPTEDEVSR